MENIKNIIYPNVAAKNLILPTYSEEISHPATIGGEAQPVLSEGLYHYYFINPASSAVRSASAYIGGEEVDGVMEVAAALSKITEAFAEDIPEFEPYIGQYYDVVTLDASSLEDGDYRIKYEANGSEIWLDFAIRTQEIYAPPTIAGENQPTVDGGSVFANFATKYPAQSLSVEADGVSFEASEVGVINEETVEAIPELAAYIGWTLYDATSDGFEAGEYTIVITADGVSDDSLTFEVGSEPDYLCFTAEEEGAKLSFIGSRTSDKTFDLPDLKYSTDKQSWTALTYTEGEEDESGYIPFSSQIFTLGLGEKVYFKGLNPNGFNQYNEETESTLYCSFDISEGDIAASGDIGTITDEVGGANCVLAEGCYYNMFYGCTSLTSAPELPATTLAEGCYTEMFNSCASLTSASSLPATTLTESCYYFMFANCTFPMSNDGTIFNFEFGATLPQTVEEDTYSTHKDVADWMGNTTGFNELTE